MSLFAKVLTKALIVFGLLITNVLALDNNLYNNDQQDIDSIIEPLESLDSSTSHSPNLNADPKQYECGCFKPKKRNPMFLQTNNLIRFEFGFSFRDNVEGIYNLGFIYSQPNTFFRLVGRLNIEVGGMFGNKINFFNQLYAGLSQDIALPLFYTKKYGNMYIGIGLGGYIKSASESRVSSNFMFGERVFIGYTFNNVLIEMFVKHYSNGMLTNENSGHNFFGASMGILF